MLETFGDGALSLNLKTNTRPGDKIQAQILSKVMAIDPERAVTFIQA